MELDLLGAHADRAYPILAGLVVPRPIAWVTTLHGNHPIGRMAVPDWYCHTADLFELPRPR